MFAFFLRRNGCRRPLHSNRRPTAQLAIRLDVERLEVRNLWTVGLIGNGSAFAADANTFAGDLAESGLAATVGRATPASVGGPDPAADLASSTEHAAGQASNSVTGDQPTIGALASLAINQNAGQQTIQLTGIGNNGDGQTLTVTAESDNPSLVPNMGSGALTVNYTSPGSGGSVTFTPVPGVNGTANITVTVTDGSGSASATEVVTVVGPPVNTVPAAQTAISGVQHTFSAADGNGLSVADAAVGSNAMEVALSVGDGTLELPNTAGVSFVSGGNGQASVTLIGSASNLNMALADVIYTSNAGYSGNDTLQLTTNDLGNTATGVGQSATNTVAINVLAPPLVLLNEIDANPPGTQDNRYEYIELQGTPGAVLTNVWLVVYNGIVANNPGVADLALNLSGRTIGSDGLLVVKSSVASGFSVPAATTVVSDPTFFTQTGGLADGTLSFFLYYTTGSFSAGTDYDPTNDGILSSLPTDYDLLDHIALLDNNKTAIGDIAYGGAQVYEADATGTPDAVTRFNGNSSSTSAAWYGGDLVDTNNVDSQTQYDPARASSNEPASSYITPGSINYPHRAPTLAANAGASVPQSSTTILTTAMLQVTDPDDTSSQLTYKIVNPPTSGTLTRIGVALAANSTFTQADIDNGYISYTNSAPAATSDNFTFTVSDGAGGTLGSSTFAITIVPFEVTSFAPNATGFSFSLNDAPNLSVLNLYSGFAGQLNAPDLTVVDGGSTVQGSLVWNAANNSATFVQTRGALAPGTYNVTLISGSAAWVDTFGNPLDNGANYTTSFTVAAAVTPWLTLPDFARGPGQTVNVNDAPTGYSNGNATALPVAISSTAGVTSVAFEVDYNSSYLNISNVALAAGTGGTLSVTNTTPGVLLVSIANFSSTAAAAAVGGTDIVDISASVPSTAITAYGASTLLNVVNAQVNGSAIPGSDSVEKVVYFGDTNGDGKLTGADASLAARNSAHLDNGFSAYPLTDPRIIADVTGTNNITAASASLIAQASVHIAEVDIPTIPTHGTITLAGVDPTIGIPSQIAAAAGQTVNVPVSITDNALGVASATMAIHFNAAVLSLTAANVTLSGALSAAGWTIARNVENAQGVAYVSIYSTTGLPAGRPQLLDLAFTVAEDARSGSTPITIDPTQSAINNASGQAMVLSIIDGRVAITGAHGASSRAIGGVGGLYPGDAPRIGNTQFAPSGTAGPTVLASNSPANGFSSNYRVAVSNPASANFAVRSTVQAAGATSLVVRAAERLGTRGFEDVSEDVAAFEALTSFRVGTRSPTDHAATDHVMATW